MTREEIIEKLKTFDEVEEIWERRGEDRPITAVLSGRESTGLKRFHAREWYDACWIDRGHCRYGEGTRLWSRRDTDVSELDPIQPLLSASELTDFARRMYGVERTEGETDDMLRRRCAVEFGEITKRASVAPRESLPDRIRRIWRDEGGPEELDTASFTSGGEAWLVLKTVDGFHCNYPYREWTSARVRECVLTYAERFIRHHWQAGGGPELTKVEVGYDESGLHATAWVDETRVWLASAISGWDGNAIQRIASGAAHDMAGRSDADTVHGANMQRRHAYEETLSRIPLSTGTDTGKVPGARIDIEFGCNVEKTTDPASVVQVRSACNSRDVSLDEAHSTELDAFGRIYEVDRDGLGDSEYRERLFDAAPRAIANWIRSGKAPHRFSARTGRSFASTEEARAHVGPCHCVLCEIPRNDAWGQLELERRVERMANGVAGTKHGVGVFCGYNSEADRKAER